MSGILLPASATPLQVNVETFVQEEELLSGEAFHYVIRVSWEGDAALIEVERPRTPELEGLQRLFTEQSSSVDAESNTSSIDFIYILHPLQTGEVKVGALNVTYTVKETGEEKTITVPPKELTIVEPPKKEFPLGAIIKVFLWGLVIALVGVLVWLVATGRMRIPALRRRWFFSDDDEGPSPYDRLIAEAATLKMHLLNGDEKKFYDKLYLLLRSLITQRTSRSLDNLTETEIGDIVSELPEEDHFPRKVIELLEKCQKVRFGGAQPTREESELDLKDIQELIQSEDRRFKKERKARKEMEE